MAAGFTDLLGVSHRASVNWLEHDRKAEKTVRRESPRPLGPLPKHVTRLIRPDGSTPLIDWTRDEDVRIVIDDLVNAGWVIIKAVAIPWKPNITINPDIVMNNQVNGNSLTVRRWPLSLQ